MKKYKSYKRNHTYQYESDVELGKIHQEKTRVLKLKRVQTKKLHQIIKDELFDDEALDEYEDVLHQEKKETNNMKVHKHRLKKLLKEDKID